MLIFIKDGSFHFVLGDAVSLLISSPFYRALTYHSLVLASVVTLLSVTIALPLSCLFGRYTFPYQTLLLNLMLLPLALPPFVGVLGIRKFLGRGGVFSLSLMELGITSSPLELLYGRIVIPLLLPSLVSGCLLVFMGSLADLGTPLLFNYRSLLSVQIFELLTDAFEIEKGYALVALLSFSSIVLFGAVSWFERRHRFDRGGTTASVWQRVPLSNTASFVAISLVGVLLLVSLLPHVGVVLLAFADRWILSVFPVGFTFAHFREALLHPLTIRSTALSAALAFGSALTNTALGFSIAWLYDRSPSRSNGLLRLLALAPLAVPGIVVAFSYLSTFSGTFLDPTSNPIPLLFLAYTVRKLPFMVLTCGAGLRYASKELEEAARVTGASTLRILLTITIPLLWRQLLGGFILCFLFSMLEVSDSLILAREERYYPVTKALYALSARPDGPLVACAVASLLIVMLLGILSILFLIGGREKKENLIVPQGVG